MALALADGTHESPPPPDPPRARGSSLAAVPLAAVVTAATLGLIQVVALDAWAGFRDKTLHEVMIRWDAGWMTKIAELGYFGFSVSPDPEELEWQSVAFFPGYPVLVRIVSAPWAVLGGEHATFAGALVVSAVASLVFAWGIAQLAVDIWQRRRTAPGRPTQQDLSVRARVALAVAVCVLAFGAPMAFIYWMPYSEALFSALVVWALVMVLRRRFLAAGVLTLFAGLTRLTVIALLLTLCAVAVVELWKWSRRRIDFPFAAVAAPAVGSLGIGAYLAWANRQVADIGGYFAAQKRGWNSEFDFGAGTLAWVREHPVLRETGDHDAVAYVLSTWVIVFAVVLCVASLWPLLRGWLPWPVWLTAVLVAGSVLGSNGIMHARPRLLLMPVLFLLLPFVVRGVQWAASDRPGRVRRGALLAGAGVLWCALGFGIFGWMAVEFRYGI
ncbi:hypothetical protein [Aeromicrobium duanguangcaii]|uniref:Glycosyltransferase RgtA/B/C/D-like domain-containing protein n=1 Tax=Aeromicrobium duanguangcaii TaxID=2968086 RepID=A0ABY5KG50_9ACTN|nr:hypothetical protein [Aeromicrobium duanguangcaii]MCD9154128.1 hypothetical protein [Aeromicrobium duanguangcaii]UUI68799.1 hypothetical protein NP095_01425 [Aeromicrobium duanguangcaii]